MSPTLAGRLHYVVFKIPVQPKPTCAFVFTEMDDPNRWHYLTDTHSMRISVKAKHLLKIMLKDSKKRFVAHLPLPCLVHIDWSEKPLHEHQEVHQSRKWSTGVPIPQGYKPKFWTTSQQARHPWKTKKKATPKTNTKGYQQDLNTKHQLSITVFVALNLWSERSG